MSAKVSPQLVDVNRIYEARTRSLACAFLPSRIPSIDRAMRGGLVRGAITEVVGPAGAGKTQVHAPNRNFVSNSVQDLLNDGGVRGTA